jgi:hypothetical protein
MPRVAWIGALLALACGPSIVFEEASETSGLPEGTTTSGPMPPPAVTSTPEPADEGEVGDSGIPDWGTVPAKCTLTDAFTCTDGVDCDQHECGDPMSPFDAHGCLRRACPCHDEEVCFRPLDYGGCVSSGVFCVSEPCGCAFTGDCEGRYCLPVDEVPVSPCFDLEHPEACAAANCAWLEGTRMQLQASTCVCGPESGLCVPLAPYGFAPEPAVVYRADDPTIGLIVAETPQPMPVGLASCDGPRPGLVCECAGPLGCV